jgi:hypothetical protein
MHGPHLSDPARASVLFSGDLFTLSTVNAFPHLDDAALLTYR